MKSLLAVLLAVAAVVYVGLYTKPGRDFTAKFHKKKPMVFTIRMYGQLSLVDGYVTLTTPNNLFCYILVANKNDEIREHVRKSATFQKSATIIGEVLPEVFEKKLGGHVVKYSVNVDQIDDTQFNEQDPVSPDLQNAIRAKLMERRDFREATLKKLRIKEAKTEVIKGKLSILNAVYADDQKEKYCLAIVDKYGDTYLLYDKQGKFKPFDRYKNFDNKVTLVVIGEITLPNTSITLAQKEEYIPFAVQKLYNEDLTEFKAQ